MATTIIPKTNDDIILNVLEGNKIAKWPSARLVKIFIASSRSDFIEERRQILEMLGPDLQIVYDEHQIEIEFVDVHFGMPESYTYDPYILEDHLNEIKSCCDVSKGCFFLILDDENNYINEDEGINENNQDEIFLIRNVSCYLLTLHQAIIKTTLDVPRCQQMHCLIGNKSSAKVLPTIISSNLYKLLITKIQKLELSNELFNEWYEENSDQFILKNRGNTSIEDWQEISIKMTTILSKCITELCTENNELITELKDLTQTNVEKQLKYAIKLAGVKTRKLIALFREFERKNDDEIDKNFFDNEATEIEDFKTYIKSVVDTQNCLCLSVPWKPGGIDGDLEEHDTYLSKFRSHVREHVKYLINTHKEEEPELVSRKKIVQEVFQENITHLSICFEKTTVDPQTAKKTNDILDKIEQHVKTNYTNNTKHCPFIVKGGSGSGKSYLIKSIYNNCSEWFSTLGCTRIFRFVRFAACTPRSAYNLELLRVICQQICIVLKLPDGFLPKDASFDPLYINNWFQNLLRRFEELINHVLIIIIDDLHKFNPLDSDIVAALSWIPISLPRNVFLIFTTAVPLELLKLTPVQKERFRSNEVFFDMGDNDLLTTSMIEEKFDEYEKYFSRSAISKLSTLITCSEYGLSETELLELLMPINSSEDILLLEDGHFNFSTFSTVRQKIVYFLREKLMSGKLLIDWSHDSIREIAKKRYLVNQEYIRTQHAEIANLFFSEFCENEENSENEEQQDPAAPPVIDIKDTPFQSTLHSDVTYSLRHVEESWIHLLKAGDSTKLKTLTVCNFDFLLAAVQTVSVSYLRCVLEHVRCYLLDRDLELVYYTIRKSSDVLTRDPLQLGSQIISWLRPSADAQSPVLSLLVTQAMAWCDGFTLPLLLPLTCWLSTPLGGCVGRGLQVSGVYQCVATPPGQHIVCVSHKNMPNAEQPTLWHVMSKQLVHTFKGHSGAVLCMHITKQSQYLITGSEDISIIVWDLKTLTLKLRIYEHIAPVLTVTSALNNSVIVSGGEDSSIIITSLTNGQVVMKIDHHRGPVTSVQVNSTGDVLVSGSHDKNICLWSLENFTLLNTITLISPIQMIDISNDSVFLLAACEDNNLYLRTLATGTELHNLVGHKSKVRSLCVAQDSCRAVVGCADGNVCIYDMHTGKIIKTITGQGHEVTCIRVTDKDDFLITAGGNKVNIYPFRETDAIKPVLSKLNRKLQQSLQAHTSYITCCDVARDNQLAASGAADNLVNIWQLTSHELIQTLDAHTAAVTCIHFAPNGLFLVSGSDDSTVKVWGLTLGTVVVNFTGHQAPITTLSVMLDSARVISADKDGMLAIWLADNGSLLQSCKGPGERLAVTNNMKYAACTNGDNTLKIWSLLRDDEKYSICHSEEITCFVLTLDSLQVVTGSRDMSLKVWQLSGGKLSQVLVGHTDAVTCVAVSALNKSLIVSGSCDTNCIVWDVHTGSDIHTLAGHLAPVTCLQVSPDGSACVSGGEDKTIIVWDTKKGILLTSLQLCIPVVNVQITCDCSRIVVYLKDTKYLPIICLHNTPAKYVKLPTYCAPAKDVEARPVPKRQMRRLLKKEVSLDTYTWQKKYGHLTSNIMIAAVDERLKRRFSVSASMEEISKIPQNKNLASQQQGQGSLAQSQHFDQLEALWNKRSPPRRRITQSLSKQSSLVESRYSSDEEDKFDQLSDLPGE